MKRYYFALTAFLLSLPAAARALTAADTGVHDTGQAVYGATAPSIGDFIGNNIINPIFGVAGVIFLAFFIYGGVLWMTAGGSTEQVGKAKKLLINSVLGLVIMFSAYAITLFLFRNLT